jgi:hypothetical protein
VITRHQRTFVALAVLAGAVLALYGRTLGYGLVWDDYLAFRDRAASELTGAWTGTWDTTGRWPAFYRPISLALYDAMFAIAGRDGFALHAITLALVLLAACLTYRVVATETGRPGLGAIAALLLIAHPETPASLSAWASQSFHAWTLVAVLATILVWQRVRDAGAAAWSLILPPATVAVLMKEDALAIVPALWLWQWARARERLGPRPSAGVTGTVAAWIVIYLLARTAAVGIGGYGTPPWTTLTWNLTASAGHAVFAHVPAAPTISDIAAALWLGLAFAAWRRRAAVAPAVRAMTVGAAALFVFGWLPLASVGGHTRIHLLIFAVSLVTAAGAAALGSLAPRGRLLAGAAAILASALALTANWAHTNWYAPCGEWTRFTDDEVRTWDVVPAAVRAEIAAKDAACDALSR